MPGSLIIWWGPENTGFGGLEYSFNQFIFKISALDSTNGIGSLEADPLLENTDNFIFGNILACSKFYKITFPYNTVYYDDTLFFNSYNSNNSQ